jgi:hypothetical protein
MYRDVCYLILIIGFSCNLFYIITIDEVALTNEARVREIEYQKNLSEKDEPI